MDHAAYNRSCDDGSEGKRNERRIRGIVYRRLPSLERGEMEEFQSGDGSQRRRLFDGRGEWETGDSGRLDEFGNNTGCDNGCQEELKEE